MSLLPPEKSDEQWIVSDSSAGQVLVEVMESLRSLPDVKVVNIIGTETSPRLLVIRATPSAIVALQNTFGNHIIITPDKPLQLFKGLQSGFNVLDKFT